MPAARTRCWQAGAGSIPEACPATPRRRAAALLHTHLGVKDGQAEQVVGSHGVAGLAQVVVHADGGQALGVGLLCGQRGGDGE